MLLLAQLTPASGYAGHVLPAMVLIGLAAGFTVAPAMSTATSGVAEQDAGIASAMVNAAQQVGGALGLAVLGTVAATDRKSTRLNSSHVAISYAVFCLKKKNPSRRHP